MPNIASHLFRNAQRQGDKTALFFEGRQFTFAQLRDQVARVAAGLTRLGFSKGDVIGLMLATGPEFIIFEYAAFSLGCPILPLNVHYKPAELETALHSYDVACIVIQGDLLDDACAAMLRQLPALRVALVWGSDGEQYFGSRFTRAESLFVNSDSRPATVELRDEDLAIILNTSGTTGRAKGVMLTIANLQANYDRTPEWLGLSTQDCILCALPLYNTFALNQCINAMMVTGAQMMLQRRFDAVECMRLIQEHQCSFFPAVPTMLQKILDDPAAAHFDLSSIRRILVGGAPVPGPLLEQVYRLIGPRTIVMTGYGLTEATALVSLEHATLDERGFIRRPKSIGRPLPGIEMAILAEDGHRLGPDEVGQICVRGSNVMKGYYKLEAETAKTIVDGWLRTGDLGTMDCDGYFYIVDRKKDLIIRGGQNIYPTDIEDTLYRHPAVAEAAVIARPDALLGEVPEAYVALKPNATVTQAQLMQFCRNNLAYFKVPKNIYLLPELPKGPTGKILRRRLREFAGPDG